MNLSHLNHKFIRVAKLAPIACLYLAIGTSLASPLLFSSAALSQKTRRVVYKPPSNLDAPKVSVPGITRSACPVEEGTCLIALLPDLKVNDAPAPQTISEHPTIYFLTPRVNGRVYFRLDEDNGTSSQRKRIYRTSFPINNSAGVVALRLPENAPKLEVNKKYSWTLDIEDNSMGTRSVHGSMRRIALSDATMLELAKTTNPIDRAALLASSGVWFDSLQTLAQAKIALPANPQINEEWNAVLKDAQLDRVLPYSLVVQEKSAY
ncbi:MAG: DUF928 domain-containing protein [Pseudanabaenaceae cyanobacterium bins.39]|nr:DUF928 domain-containing protein [Pseudanabaenaceae cyanobacterium bins.39]